MSRPINAVYNEKPAQSLYRVLSFVKRDFKLAVSYHLDFLFRAWSIFFQVMIFFYISRIFGPATSSHLAAYDAGYFPFVLIGIAILRYFSYGVSSFSKALSEQQMLGTLEAMLVTGTSLYTIILASSLWGFISTTIEVMVYFFFAIIIFDMKVNLGSVSALLTIFFLTIATSCGIGFISASFIMVFKRGDPVGMLAASFSIFFGGVFFPITVMPEWLQKVSYIFPIYYSLDAARLALLKEYGFMELLPDLMALFLFSAILLPLGFFALYYSVNRAKADGSLTQY